MTEDTTVETPEPPPPSGREEVVRFLSIAVVNGMGIHWAAATGYVFVDGVNGYPVAFPARPLALRPHH